VSCVVARAFPNTLTECATFIFKNLAVLYHDPSKFSEPFTKKQGVTFLLPQLSTSVQNHSIVTHTITIFVTDRQTFHTQTEHTSMACLRTKFHNPSHRSSLVISNNHNVKRFMMPPRCFTIFKQEELNKNLSKCTGSEHF
jgi:hypothetical protein